MKIFIAGFIGVFLAFFLNASERQSWMPPESISGGATVIESSTQNVPKVTLTSLPKKTANINEFNKIYTIDLKKFNISNNKTNPKATVEGINNALQYAKSKGYNRIVFPKGTYIVPKDQPIKIDLKNAVIDFNGATITIEPNNLLGYSIVQIVNGAENLRLTNGRICGDKLEHDYKTIKGTHEHGCGLNFVSGKELEVDNMIIENCTGDGIGSSTSGALTRPELLARIFYDIYPKKHIENGAFDASGKKVEDKTKTRTNNMINLSKFEDCFEIGYLAGYQGFPFVLGRDYQIYFYDINKKFIEKQTCRQYKKVYRPKNAQFMNLEFNQPEISDIPAHSGAAPKSWVLRINNFLPSVDVHLHHNILRGNRRLGMSLHSQRWIIEYNKFIDNGGTPPAYGIDLEDGWELTYDIVFRNNFFKGNTGGGIVICAGSEIVFENNTFESTPKAKNRILFYGRTYNYTFKNNIVNGGVVTFATRSGVASISNNKYKNIEKFTVTFDNKGVADGIYRSAKNKKVSTPPLILKNENFQNVKFMSGTYLVFDKSKFENVNIVANAETKMLLFENSNIINSTINYMGKEQSIYSKFKNNIGSFIKK